MADTGSLLLSTGLVTSEALADARDQTRQFGGTIAEYLVLSGAVDDEELTLFYRRRLMVPRVNPDQLARIPDRIVRQIPADMAAEFRVIPVVLDHDQNLTVAMSEPGHSHAVDEIRFFTGNYVVRAVATQRQLAWCLAHYYGHLTILGETLLGEDDEARGSAAAVAPAPTARLGERVAAAISSKRRRESQRGLPLEDTQPTEQMAAPVPERRKRPTTLPELRDKAGEVVARAPTVAPVDSGPAVVVDETALGDPSLPPDTLAEHGTESKPILLRKKTPSDSEVVLLDKPKSGPTQPRAASRETDVGVGVGRSGVRKRPSTLPPEPPPSGDDDLDETSEAPMGFIEAPEASALPALAPGDADDTHDPSTRLVETLRRLDNAESRDQVILALIEHVALDCKRSAFFVVKSSALKPFTSPNLPPFANKAAADATLALGPDSTFQELVNTRLPFHGPLRDPASKSFLAKVFSAAPEGPCVIVPISVKNRVVGLLYGDSETQPLHSHHLAAAARAAGVALEKVVRRRRDSTATTQE